MLQSEKLKIVGRLNESKGILTIRYTENKDNGGFFSLNELKYLKKVNDEIKSKSRVPENLEEFDAEFPDKDTAKTKMKEKYPNEDDMDSIVDESFEV